MADNVLNQAPQDKTPVWLKNKHGVVSCTPQYLAVKLLKDKNREFEITEPEFVPKKRINAVDDEKFERAKKRTNTEKTMGEITEIIDMEFDELKEFAKEKEINLQGIKTKKQLLEKLEAEKVLY